MLLAKVNEHTLYTTQVVTRNPRPNVVHSLELQTTMKPVHPCGTINVQRRKQLCSNISIGTIIIGHALIGGHTEMTQGNLHVQDARNIVRQDVKQHTTQDSRKLHGQCVHPHMKPYQRPNLPLPLPHILRRAVNTDATGMQQTLHVQIEPRERHDGIVQPVLILDEHMRRFVQRKIIIEPRAENFTLQKPFRNGKNGQMLNVRIMLDRIGHNVVHIMTPLPPTDAEPRKKVTKK
mmetsp:Transcript_14621/g.22580  ORF Transcript_14621/g.22580 Transcript_14621/m.22580 type:complete len:234 (+) Transcript_14621:584-1285(+)